ncbi:F0F1 ATP synthase subunit B [Campylobacter insulaenigrae]|uniref:F0F1 ATP synthase subunit B n=1 Tax=Campylobacter insulaenigrae TaxID=260714 RepID=UPI000F6C49F8|nr:F0F1 ATP synthase subunit B [Campylobacter insulaenigrae]MCR6591691.1 F0F1 ATP synthase subunit B [Campylobacter insulaenigrae]MCR6593229.1 F0F1 ATP synthase subunit B [Campylobacter insulaenigrae]MCR6594479.1 F0F1 ATP synthase subunit B [Campylobacter insulaenigrae]VEJ52536.1 ATP synthase F0F1 subunit B [Campylobacter insulaenigrae]
MIRNILLMTIIPFYVFAAGDGSGDYDILPRTVNFILFVAILYYFIATPIKKFYNDRINKISSKMNEIQEKLIASKNLKLEMMKKLDLAKQESINAVALAKKEAEILASKIENETKTELSVLEKSFQEHKKYEIRKMEKEVINSVLEEVFKDDNSYLKQEDIINIMMKKAS